MRYIGWNHMPIICHIEREKIFLSASFRLRESGSKIIVFGFGGVFIKEGYEISDLLYYRVSGFVYESEFI